MAGTVVQWLRIPALVSGSVAVIASSLLYFKQNELIYPRNIPPGSRVDDPRFQPSQFGISICTHLHLPTPDGETLSTYFIRPTNAARARHITVLMFHGNAGNIAHRLPIAKVLADSMGLDVVMLEYRGYGLSTGTPDEKGLNVDAQTGLDWIRNHDELGRSRIVVYGQSLGGAVAVQLVAKNQRAGDIGGLVLENTFLSIRKMIPAAFPPARYLAPLCHQIWSSEETIPLVKDMPVLFLSGLRDEIVPPSHMKQLYNLCRVDTKIWKDFPNGDHNSSVGEAGYFEAFAEFIREQVVSKK